MALTPVRWVLLLLLVCTVMVAAYLPPADIAESARWSPYASADRRETARSRLASAAERWAALSELETLRRSAPGDDAPVLIARSGLRPEVSRAVDSLLRTIWHKAPRADSSVRLRVVASAYTETLDLWTAALEPEVVLPELTDGHTCLVIIPAILQHGSQSANTLGWWKNNLRRQVGQAVAPCVLRAVLGQPGPEVGRWLATRGYDLAASIGWAVGGNAGVEYGESWFDRFEWSEIAMPGLMQRIIGALPAPYAYSVGAASCAGGRPARCGELITAAPKRYPGPGPMIRIGTLRESHSGGLTSHDGTFISDLIQERGLEPFRRFWTSTLPVDAAFSDAYGTSLDDWTRDWVRRRVGEVELGAPTHLIGAFAGLLASLLVVAVTATAAASREVA